MKKLFAVTLFALAIFGPAMSYAARPDGDIPQYDNLPSNPNMCWENGQLVYCPANAPTKSKKRKNTGEIVVISVAVGAVFVGAMYYIFKKMPSENNPGQVKLMEF
ncbi:MAG: hypothetical protein K2I81_02665 [Alphaproteobacteria bacterium]|nr:hypothetical protein [Alphaproteobacteria bacterium]